MAGLGILGVATYVVTQFGSWFRRRSLRGPQAVAWISPSGIKSAYKAGNALATLSLYSASAIKIADGASGAANWRDRQNGSQTNGGWIDDYMRECTAAGVPISGWGFHYLLTVPQAQMEGAKAAESALYHKVKAYSCNCEIQWLKGRMDYKKHPYMPTSHISATAMAFNQAFRSVAPGIRLHITPMMHMKSIWGPLLTPAWLSKWDGLERMLFATSLKTLSARWTETRLLAEKAQALNPNFSYVPLWATGSVETTMDYAGAQSHVLPLEAVEPTGLIGIYYGNYAGTMWATGNKYGPPWSQIIPALQGRSTISG
tara:strand:+ start:120 stop:1061 length:942 start_codon:yes stop_codon:yes gene_type:complete